MRILHLISQHPESTGSGFYLQNVIRQAAAAGHRNYLVAGISANQLPLLDGIGPTDCRFVSFGNGPLDFAIPGMSDVMPYPSTRFGDLTADQLAAYDRVFAETIGNAAADFSPDVVHSHHLWLASSIARRVLPDIPMVTSCHSTDLRQLRQCPHLSERVLGPCRRIERILALSRDQAEKIEMLYTIPADRIDLVGGGFDDRLFQYGRKPPPQPIHLLYAGKMSFAKGVDWLLRTFIQLSEPDLHLHLAGSGTGREAEACLELARQAGSTVTVHGGLSQQELAELMKLYHIFILPSFYEGLPLVLLEALASGCRIIATDLPGCRELLTETAGDLVSFIGLPAMTAIDRPDHQDWPILQSQLAATIADMANRVRCGPSPSAKDIFRITSSAGWPAVFARIFSSYEKAMAG
jgi:glycosyltransferase involved in cell wall biosynthesis